MQQRHLNRRQYFQEQAATTRKYVIPYIAAVKSITKNTRVLEIGCGEGGNLEPFVELGCQVVGVDINASQIERAREYLAEQFPKTQPVLLAGDIYEVDPAMIGQFDVVMLRDVIEHIPDQDRFFKHVRSYLQPAGVIFLGFPPWYMPFGDHQQVCHSKFLSKLPWFHPLPFPLFRDFCSTCFYGVVEEKKVNL